MAPHVDFLTADVVASGELHSGTWYGKGQLGKGDDAVFQYELASQICYCTARVLVFRLPFGMSAEAFKLFAHLFIRPSPLRECKGSVERHFLNDFFLASREKEPGSNVNRAAEEGFVGIERQLQDVFNTRIGRGHVQGDPVPVLGGNIDYTSGSNNHRLA